MKITKKKIPEWWRKGKVSLKKKILFFYFLFLFSPPTSHSLSICPSLSLSLSLSLFLSLALSLCLSLTHSLSLSLSHSASFFFPFFLCSRWCEGEGAVRWCAELWRTCCLRGCQFRKVRTFLPNNRSGVLELIFLRTDVFWIVNEIYLLFIFIHLFISVCVPINLSSHLAWLRFDSSFVYIYQYLYLLLFICVCTYVIGMNY